MSEPLSYSHIEPPRLESNKSAEYNPPLAEECFDPYGHAPRDTTGLVEEMFDLSGQHSFTPLPPQSPSSRQSFMSNMSSFPSPPSRQSFLSFPSYRRQSRASYGSDSLPPFQTMQQSPSYISPRQFPSEYQPYQYPGYLPEHSFPIGNEPKYEPGQLSAEDLLQPYQYPAHLPELSHPRGVIQSIKSISSETENEVPLEQRPNIDTVSMPTCKEHLLSTIMYLMSFVHIKFSSTN